MLMVAVGALVLTALFYRRAYGVLPPRQWFNLFGLRAAAILLVVILLFRPLLSFQSRSDEKPALVFLLDASASMSIADDESGISRFEQARTKLLEWQRMLRNEFRLLPVVFAIGAEPLASFNELAKVQPTGKATSLSNAVAAAAKHFSPAEIAAVVLLSDGIHNALGNPIEAARRSGLKIHCFGVGTALRNNANYRDVQVLGIDCPERLLRGNLARITAMIDARGLSGHVVSVHLEEDGRPLAHSELTLDDLEGGQQVIFEFRPTEKGRHEYTVKVEPPPHEKIIENNQRSAVATVVEASIRVLYIEGTLRPEYGALVDRFLAKDPDLEFTALVLVRPNVFLVRGNTTDPQLKDIPDKQEVFDKFDVFFIGDIDSSYFSTVQQEMLLKRVRAGGGLLMLGGYHGLGPGGYGSTPLGAALPLELGPRDIGQYDEPFLPVLTPEGVRHPIFANIVDFFPDKLGGAKQAGLPPLSGCTRVLRAKPGATVLATLSPETDAMPVLAVQPLERGRTAVFCGDTTRNWQQGPLVFGRESPFVRFWGQMVRWLAGRSEALEAEAGVTAAADKAVYQPGEKVRLSALVRNPQGQGVANARVSAEIKGPAGDVKNVPLDPQPGPAGHYAVTFDPKAAGRYEATVTAAFGEGKLVSERLAWEVGRPNLEFERLDLDEKMLSEIAAVARGRYTHISAADHFLKQLERERQAKTIFVEYRLYWPPACWILLVSALTVEWVLRKRYQLR